MSHQPPPSNSTNQYNSNSYSSSTSNLTIADADLRYLQLSGGTELGSVLFSAGLQLANTGAISTVSNEKIQFSTSSIDLQVDAASVLICKSTGPEITGNLKINNTTITAGSTVSIALPSTTGTLALVANVVDLASIQTISGQKTFSSNPKIANSSFASTIAYAGGSDTTLTIPATTGTIALVANVVDLASIQTISGQKTFSSNPKISNSSFASTIAYAGGSDTTLTIPATTGTIAIAAEVVDLISTQIISGAKVFSGIFKIANGSNQCLLSFLGSSSITLTLPTTAGTLALLTDIPSVTQISLANGSFTTPSLNFGSDTSTGLYRIGSGNVGISLAGALNVDLTATRSKFISKISLPDGVHNTPSLTFTSNTALGLNVHSGSVGLDISCSSTDYLTLLGAQTANNGVEIHNGNQSQYIYMNSSGDSLEFYTSTSNCKITTTGLTSSVQVVSKLGTVSSPAYSFNGDLNTGFYHTNASEVSSTCGGVRCLTHNLSTGNPQITLYNSSAAANCTIIANGTVNGAVDTTISSSSGNLYLEAGGANFVRSATILAATTASASNVVINGASVLQKSTSSRRYKKEIADLEDSDLKKILTLQGKKYKSLCPGDPDQLFYGLIAEEVFAILPELCELDTTGQCSGLQYTQIIAFLLEILKRHELKLKSL